MAASPASFVVGAPAPTGSPSRSCSKVSAHLNRDVEAGLGLRPWPLGFTSYFARNSAQENSDRWDSGAPSWCPLPRTGSTVGPMPST